MPTLKTITYYLGAGASANALPVVGEKFNQRFGYFCEIIRLKNWQLRQDFKNQTHLFIEKIHREFGYYYSPDTYARKLFFNDKQHYEAFKQLLSAYFVFEQFYRGNLAEVGAGVNREANIAFSPSRVIQDPRYDVIFAALLDENATKLPSNLRVISWNYDLQFEKSFSDFTLSHFSNAFSELAVYPNPSSIRIRPTAPDARMVKINGTAGMHYDNGDNKIYFPEQVKDYNFETMMSELINGIEQILLRPNNKPRYESMLQFAWENSHEVREARIRAENLIEETDILVIIGYSFPLYNRRIDKQILQRLSSDATVYLQVSSDKYNTILNRFKLSLIGKYPNVTRIEELDQFYVPDELL